MEVKTIHHYSPQSFLGKSSRKTEQRMTVILTLARALLLTFSKSWLIPPNTSAASNWTVWGLVWNEF